MSHATDKPACFAIAVLFGLWSPSAATLNAKPPQEMQQSYWLGDPAELCVNETIESVSFSADSAIVRATTARGRLWSLSLRTGTCKLSVLPQRSDDVVTLTGTDTCLICRQKWLEVCQLPSLTQKRFTELAGAEYIQVSAAPTTTRILLRDHKGHVYLWDPQKTDAPKRCEGFLGKPRRFFITPDGEAAITVLDRIPRDRGSVISLISLKTGETLHHFTAARATALAIAHKQKLLALGHADGAVTLWKLDTGTFIFAIREQSETISAVAFSPDDTTLATGTSKGNLMVLDVETGNPRISAEDSRRTSIAHLVYSPDGRMLCSASEIGIQLWELSSRQQRLANRHALGSHVTMAFSPRSTLLALGGSDGNACVVSLNDLRTPVLAKQFAAGVVSASLCTDDNAAAFSTQDGAITHFDLRAQPKLRKIASPINRSQVHFGSGNAELIAFPTELDGKLFRRNFSADSWEAIASIKGGKSAVAVSSNGARIAARREDGVVAIYSLPQGKYLSKTDSAVPTGSFLFIDKDGAQLLALSPEGEATWWDTTSGKKTREWKLALAKWQRVQAAAFSFQTSRLVVSTENSPPNKQEEQQIRLKWAVDEIVRPGLHPIAFEVYDSEKRELTGRTYGPLDSVQNLALSSDGKWLCAAGEDNGALLFEIVAEVHGEKRPQKTTKEFETLWAGLREANGATAFETMGILAESGDNFVDFVGQNLLPAPVMKPDELMGLLQDLGSDVLNRRQRAMQELRKIGVPAIAAVRTHINGKISLEERKRGELVLRQLLAQAPEHKVLQTLRAIEVLEWIGSKKARAVLQLLSTGQPHHPITVHATAALSRLSSR